MWYQQADAYQLLRHNCSAMAPVHTVTSKKEVVVYEPPQSRSQTTSRWDALLRESDTGASSTRQRRPLATNRGRCHASHHWGQVGEQPGGKFRTDSNGGNRSNWRRPPASDDSSSPGRSAEDAAVIEALDQVRDSINTYLHDKRDKYGDGEECSTFVHRSIEQLAASIFQEIDTTTILIEIPCHHLLINVNSTKQSLPNVSTAVIWKAGYSLLQQVHLLSESSHSCYQLIHFLSFVALHCLRSVTSNRQPEIIIISTADACECLSMLVGILGCHIFENNNLSGNNNNNTEDDAVKCKNTLMACMAVMLSFSTKKSGAPPGKDKKKIDIPPSLLPWGAEKTVHVVLKETALPFLELLMKENDGVLSSCSSENIIYCYGAMECLYILLRDPKWETNFDAIVPAASSQLSKYASAILAPLIVDILPDGKEKQHTNPLRSKTLMAICNFWDCSFEYIIEKKSSSDEEAAYRSVLLLMSCKCMAAAVNALAALRKSKSQNAHDVPREINVNTIARQLQSMFRSDELRSYRPKFLSIMALLCLAYPSASANQWHIFIEQSSTTEALLLSFMDSGAVALSNGDFEDECWIALPNALHAASALLTAMPFSLWISGEARSLTRMSGGNFASRIRTALLGVMHCICHLMSAVKARICIPSLSDPSTEIVMRLVSEVAGKLCTILPFGRDNMLLLHSAVRIMQCAGDIYVDSVSAELHEPTMHSSLCSKAISTFGSVIIESLGTCSVALDTKSMSTNSAPAMSWLSSASSYDFIGLLLTDSRWPCPSSRERMDMLSALAKGSPSTLVREPFNLASFCEVCTYQSQNGSGLNSRTQGLQLIESFIHGRKASIECSSNSSVDVVIRQTFSPILLTALEDSSATIRTCAVSSFGSLLQRDWMECIDASTIDNAPLGSILRLCSAKNENVASVRAASCKAIGDIFISCTDGTLHHAKNSSDDSVSLGDGYILTYSCMVCKEMRNALDDKAASVRSMVSVED